jgi:hypothetical protein
MAPKIVGKYSIRFIGTNGRVYEAEISFIETDNPNGEKNIYVLCTSADLEGSDELHGNAIWAGYGKGIFTGVFGSSFYSVSEAIAAIDKAAKKSFFPIVMEFHD